MFPYILIYLVCIGLGKYADIHKKNLNQSHKAFKYYLALSAIIILPSILAGMRDNDIGTDISYYAEKVFYSSNKEPDSMNGEIDSAFYILSYISHFISNRFGFFLFLIEAWILSFYCFALHLMRKHLSITIAITMFMLLNYNQSLNIMRQYMALSVLLCCLAYLLKKEYRKSIFFFILAYLCHSTSIIAFIFYILYWGYSKFSYKRFFILFVFTLILLGFFIYVLYDYCLIFFIESGLLKESYQRYISYHDENASLTNIVCNLFTLLIIGNVVYRSKVTNMPAILCLSILVIQFFFSFISFGGEITSRISLYFSYMTLLLIPISMFKAQRSSILLILLLFFYEWWFTIYINNYGETVPYSSKFLGI